jgi:MFS family permease
MAGVLRPYLDVLSLPGARSFAFPGILARLPMSMVNLAIVVMVAQKTGSFAIAGAVSAAYEVCYAGAGPALARIADRRGQRFILLPALVVNVAGLLGLVLTSLLDWPTAVFFPFAILAGCAAMPFTSFVRMRWSVLLGGTAGLATALAFESICDEAVFMAGPVLVTTLAALTATAGLWAAIIFVTIGTLLFVRARATEPPPSPPHHHRGAVRIPGMLTVAGAYVALGACFGTVDVTMVAFATEHGWRSIAGLLLAMVAFGSLLAGLVYGSRTWRRDIGSMFTLALCLLVVGTVLLSLPRSGPWMIPAALLAGVAISPTLISGSGVIDRVVPAAVRTEGFALGSSAINVGAAIGAAVAGPFIDAFGASKAFVICPVAALIAAIVATSRRRSLRPVPGTIMEATA